MSSHYEADNFFEKEQFVEGLKKLGHPGCQVEYIKGGRYRIISPLKGKHWRQLVDEFKRRKIRQLSPKYLEQEQGLL